MRLEDRYSARSVDRGPLIFLEPHEMVNLNHFHQVPYYSDVSSEEISTTQVCPQKHRPLKSVLLKRWNRVRNSRTNSLSCTTIKPTQPKFNPNTPSFPKSMPFIGFDSPRQPTGTNSVGSIDECVWIYKQRLHHIIDKLLQLQDHVLSEVRDMRWLPLTSCAVPRTLSCAFWIGILRS